MRNTVKAKVGYVIWFKKSKPNKVIVCDGDDVLFKGERRSWEDYKDEVLDDGNVTKVLSSFTFPKKNITF